MQHQPVEEAAKRRRDGQTGVNRLPGEDGAEGVAPPRNERAADGAEQVSGNGVGQKAEADAQPVAEVDGSDAAEDDCSAISTPITQSFWVVRRAQSRQ